MKDLLDTIIAPISGQTPSAIAVLRISGPRAWEVARAVFPTLPTNVSPRRALYGEFVIGDDGLVLPFAEGHSFTGEQTAELSVHGSAASVRALLEACYAAGARPAEPGEFTYRAFMNDKLDLTQSEGVLETIESRTSQQLSSAHALKQGALKERIDEIIGDLSRVLAEIEASTDFSEEIGEFHRGKGRANLDSVLWKLNTLAKRHEHYHLLRDGLVIALMGRPNSGKSSLLNTILSRDRALVSSIPGTTRDTIEESVVINGCQVQIIDTAGLRDSEETVEQMGIEKSREVAQNADLIWYLYDLSEGFHPEDSEFICEFESKTTLIGNKSDLVHDLEHFPGIKISTKTGEGLEQLFGLVQLPEGLDSGPIPNRRHAPLIKHAAESVQEAFDALEGETPIDLATVPLMAAMRLLKTVTGAETSEDVLEQIFRDFCIGK